MDGWMDGQATNKLETPPALNMRLGRKKWAARWESRREERTVDPHLPNYLAGSPRGRYLSLL